MSSTGFSSGLTDTALRALLQKLDEQGFREVHWTAPGEVLSLGQYCRRRIRGASYDRRGHLWEIRWCEGVELPLFLAPD